MGSHVKQYFWGLSKLTWGLVNRRSCWYGSLPSLQNRPHSLQETDWLAFIDLCPVFTASPDRPNSLLAVWVSNLIIGVLALSSISPCLPAIWFAFTLTFFLVLHPFRCKIVCYTENKCFAVVLSHVDKLYMGPGQLYQDLQNLIHDLSLVNQISSMISSLKGNYQVLCDTSIESKQH